jgi:hypothetical protein
MHWLFVLLASIILSPATIAAAQTAPSTLRGKSVVVSWTEQRSLRRVGEANFRETSTLFSVSIYISSAGRPFSRISASPGRISGSADYVGVSGSSNSGGARQVTFRGNSLSMTTSMTSGGARNVTVDFSGSGCTARVITAKQVGSQMIRSKSLASGAAIEIRSVAVVGTRCSVRDGNVFGQ